MDDGSSRRVARLAYALVASGVMVHYMNIWLQFQAPGLLDSINFPNDIWTVPSWIDLLRGLWAQGYYPPLYKVFLFAAHRLAGNHPALLVVANSLFAPLGAIYLTRLSLGLGMGLFSFLPGLALLVFPGTVWFSTAFEIDAPLQLLVPAFAYHVLASDRFERRSHVLFAAAFAALGLLTKWTFPIYVAVYLALATAPRPWVGIRGGTTWRLSRRQGMNLALGAAIAAFAAGVWYVGAIRWSHFFATTLNDPNSATYSVANNAASLWRNMESLASGRFSAALAVLVAAGFLVGRRRAMMATLLLLGIAAPLFVLALPTHYEPRYLIPTLPALALALGLAAAGIARRGIGAAMAAGIVAVLLLAYFPSPAENPYAKRPAGELIGKYLLTLQAKAPTPLRAWSHPIWANLHIAATGPYLVSRWRDHQARVPIDYTGSYYLDYPAFHERLTEGGVDVLVLDCGPSGDCGGWRRELVLEEAAMASRFGYVDGATGVRMPPFSATLVFDDWPAIRRGFVEAGELPLEDDSHTRFFVRRDLVGRLLGEPAATPR